ncbi:hypothetical protein MRB53_025030 [Persea americana]|uniref:Uncharacterized protein n=1 Tax=Persea americana TaxID=3435 RepID=A0ACC2LDX1_PERAE|nr:hypothetical protein MRB53_025030 [Persea americana]
MLLLFFPALFASSLLLHPMHASIPLGSSLSPTTKNASWLSPSGLFAFGFYNQGSGFAVGVWLETHPNKTIVWTANRDDPPVPPSAKLFLTEGGLLLQTPGSQDKNISGYIFSSPATSASLLDSGNFILYDSRSEIIWETFGFPTDTILAGQKLFVGNQLVSSISDTNHSTGRFRMNMQEDENLVLYSMGTDDTPENAYWASMTNGRTRIRSLYLNISGYIGLVDSGNSTIMQLLGEHLGSRSGTIVYRATLDTDGIFRRYSHHFMWNNVSVERDDVTPVSTKCLVKGICGINSYCIQMDAPKYDCFCLPGYKFKDPNQQLMGCFRNFSDEDCMGKKDRMTYFITPERNMTWQDRSYEILQSNSEEDCKAKCLGDCFCGAAVFDGQNCNKLRIPLKYGIRDTSVSATTMIKVGTESTMNTNTNETVFTEIERKSGSHKANRDDPPAPPSTKLLLTEGGLLLQTPGSPDKNISGHISSSASSASLLDSGNFILYDSRSEIIWGTFDFPTDTILAGQQLLEGNQLVSSISGTDHSTGRFRIKLQGDGNFVSYPVGENDNSDTAYWASGSNTVQTWENMSLYLNFSGSISLINRSSNFIRMNLLEEPVSSSSGTTVYRATLDPDGIFRRYSHEFKGNNVSIESTDVTPIRNMCVVKGICGINSYCTQMDASFVCLCLTGYEFKDLNQQFMGCLRNFSNENCMGKKDRMTYSMSPLKNMTWQDSSYETLPSNSEEDCNDKCLGDCLCGAAMFDGQNCNKLRIPLKFGRRDTSVSETTLIKVGKENPVNINQTVFHNSTNFTEIKRKGQSHKDILITFDAPTDTILAGQKLEDCQLVSNITDTNHSTGRFWLRMQSDGNLVLYPVGTVNTDENSYWSTGTYGIGIQGLLSLYLNASGVISLVNSTNSTIMQLLGLPSSSNRGMRVYRATLDPDGIFRRYSHKFEGNNSSLESTDVTQFDDKCIVKGTCEINSYCTPTVLWMLSMTAFVCLVSSSRILTSTKWARILTSTKWAASETSANKIALERRMG